MDGQSVQGQVKVLIAAVPPQDHTPLLALEPFSGGLTSSVGWEDRPGVLGSFPMLNFFASCLAIPEELFPGEGNVYLGQPGHLKTMEVSSIGTSSTHWRCVPSILPPVGFVILFSSTPSYCYCGSQSIFTLFPERNQSCNSITQSPPKTVDWMHDVLRMQRILMHPDSALPTLQCLWGKGSHSSCYPPYP